MLRGSARINRSLSLGMNRRLQILDDVAKDVAHNGAQEQEDGDHYDSDQHQDQRVFYETLTFFAR